MGNFSRAIAFIMVLVVLSTYTYPIAVENSMQNETVLPSASRVTAATNLVVTNKTINYNQAFNDDDFLFHAYNGTLPIAGANVSLYNTTDLKLYTSKTTVGDGSALFINVPPSSYRWNVTMPLVPSVFRTGIMVSNGPEAYATVKTGNLDWHNNDDDLNATVIDIEGNPAKGLNFSIVFRNNSSVWNQVVLGTNGSVYFSEIPKGNYTWKITVASGTYVGLILRQGNFTSDGTPVLVHQTVGPLFAGAQYYGLEVFTYYETSLAPVSGALVNVTYKNGTGIDNRYTPANGTVRFLELPVAFINWTVVLDGKQLGKFWYNLTTISTDIRKPVIAGPGNKEFLYGTKNITITWTVSDENPQEIKIYVNSTLNKTTSWVTSPYNCTLNVTGYALNKYSVRLVAKDKNSNTAEDTIQLRIYENATPVINGPSDVQYYFNQTGHTVRWNVSEAHMDKYVISRNGTSISNGSLDPDKPYVSVNVDGLKVGTYIYSCMVNDTSGNFAIDNVTVLVKRDDVLPVFAYTPPSIYYSLGDTNMVRNWTVTDDFKLTYNITVDGALVVSGLWKSEKISFDFAGLSQGLHSVVLTVVDLGNNSVSSTVTVVVSPPLVVEAMIVAAVTALAVVIVVVVLWFVKYR